MLLLLLLLLLLHDEAADGGGSCASQFQSAAETRCAVSPANDDAGSGITGGKGTGKWDSVNVTSSTPEDATEQHFHYASGNSASRKRKC
eukprot:COSAG01_NODE_3809_length_5675_cov_5.163349_2_plen_89_part_00